LLKGRETQCRASFPTKKPHYMFLMRLVLIVDK
jgi:hypothetical protein